MLRGLEEYLSYTGTPEQRMSKTIAEKSWMRSDVVMKPLPEESEEEKEVSGAVRHPLSDAAILAAAGLAGISKAVADAALGGADRPQLGSAADAADDSTGTGPLTIAAAAVAGAAVLAGGAILARRYFGGNGVEPPPAPQPRGAAAAPAARGGSKRRK